MFGIWLSIGFTVEIRLSKDFCKIRFFYNTEVLQICIKLNISVFNPGHGTSFVTAVPLVALCLMNDYLGFVACVGGNNNRSGRKLGFINWKWVGALLQSSQLLTTRTDWVSGRNIDLGKNELQSDGWNEEVNCLKDWSDCWNKGEYEFTEWVGAFAWIRKLRNWIKLLSNRWICSCEEMRIQRNRSCPQAM